MSFFGKIWEGAKNLFNKGKEIVNGGIGKLTNSFSFLKAIPQIGNYIKNMDAQDIKYGKMCKEVYKPPSQRLNVEDYRHSNDTDQYCIYSNGHERVMAIRGTETRDNYSDLGTDINIMLGSETTSNRFMSDLEFASNNNIDKLTGHSLGGSIAGYISNQLNIPAVIFAPGSGKSQLTNLFKTSNSKIIKCYKVEGDPVSYLWNSGDVRVLLQRADNPHTINNFI